MDRKILAGIDIGGTKTAIVLSRRPPVILKRVVFPTLPKCGPEYGISQIISAMREALLSHDLRASNLMSIGISCGGPLDPVKGLVQAPPNLPTWIDVPITSILQDEFDVPCFLENDANAGALAEYWYGAGTGTKNMVFLTMGTGLGAGLILDGRLYRGSSYLAGEVGHMRLTRTGPCGYGKIGSAEGWASGGGMAQIAQSVVRQSLSKGLSSSLAPDGRVPESITARDIWEAAQREDAVSKRIVHMTGKKLGEVLSILIDLLNPEKIVIGGLALRMGDALLTPAREVVRREALSATADVCQILPAVLGEEIGDVAAICVALNADATAAPMNEVELITT